jgi:hypothetical protein
MSNKETDEQAVAGCLAMIFGFIGIITLGIGIGGWIGFGVSMLCIAFFWLFIGIRK